jgi:hypothetical protein
MKIDRGCEKDSPVPDRWQLDEYRFQRCPKKEVSADIQLFIVAYNFFKQGVLPNTGGWLDQSHKYLQAVQFIDAEVSDIMKRASQKMRKM